jgi:hypothetical protein
VLRQHVGGVVRDAHRLEAARVHHLRGHRAFHQVVDVGGDHDRAADLVHGVARPAQPLQGARHALGRGDHHDEVDEADVDAHLQAGRADHGAQFALLKPVLHVEPDLPVERRVVHLDLRGELRQNALQLQPDVLRTAARVGEDERGAERFQQLAQFLEDARGGVARGRIRIAPQRREDFHDRFLRLGRGDDLARPTRTGEKLGHGLQRRDRRGKADAAKRRVRPQAQEPLCAHHEMRAALVLRERMDLIDDEEPPLSQRGKPRVLAQQNRERFRRGDQEVRRLPALRRPFLERRVAGAHADAYVVEAELRQGAPDVLLQVIRQRAQRRNVDRDHAVRQRPRRLQLRQMIEDAQERRERLPASRRRADQHRPRREHVLHGLHLHVGRLLEFPPEPLRDLRLQRRE